MDRVKPSQRARTGLLSLLTVAVLGVVGSRCITRADPATEAYWSYLESMDAEGAAIAELRQDRLGAWRFFHARETRTAQTHPAAIGPGNSVLLYGVGEGWHAFLTQPALDARTATERAAWLMGNPPLAQVAPPALTLSPDGGVTLTYWVALPPRPDDPVRVRIVAPPSGPARFEQAVWKDL